MGNSPLLYDADTAEPIGPATPEQVGASSQAAERDGGAGIIRIATDGTPVADGTWGADQPGVRRVYTDGPSIPGTPEPDELADWQDAMAARYHHPDED